MWRQRGHGEFLLAAPEERARSVFVADPAGAAPRDCVVDRGEVSPETEAASAREADTGRVRDHNDGCRCSGGINPGLNQNLSRPEQWHQSYGPLDQGVHQQS